jgi:hypothetical protein
VRHVAGEFENKLQLLEVEIDLWDTETTATGTTVVTAAVHPVTDTVLVARATATVAEVVATVRARAGNPVTASEVGMALLRKVEGMTKEEAMAALREIMEGAIVAEAHRCRTDSTRSGLTNQGSKRASAFV